MKNMTVQELAKEMGKYKGMSSHEPEWWLPQVERLTEVLENAGARVSNYMQCLLLHHVNGLRIGQSGNVCYLSNFQPSKRILNILHEYNTTIKRNFWYIYLGEK